MHNIDRVMSRRVAGHRDLVSELRIGKHQDVLSASYSPKCHIGLPMTEACLAQVQRHSPQSLTLGLVNGHGIGKSKRKLPS